ncbi:MAG: DUF1553 domain-containing protein [Chthoniobacteraceae bacterium]|nr:DUF1553 domain-containing protein [Chthoniobacteraceae bacterium]
MKALLLVSLFSGAALCASAGESVFESGTSVPPTKSGLQVAPLGKLDSFVFARLQKKGLEPALPCSDGVFVRRVYLDVIGTLPTADEARAFLDDPSPQKRSALIDRLLERDEFADYWGMKWGDLLRVKSEFPVNLWPNAAQAYDRWIRTALRQNRPYPQCVRELLTASGSNFRSPAVNFYRTAGSHDPQALARIAALAFLGERMEKWPEEKRAAFAVFFSQIGFKATGEWKEEIVTFSGVDEKTKPQTRAAFPDGTRVSLPPEKDPREVLANWLVSSPNSPLARVAVNRVWYWLLGQGIVQEPDDFRRDNPPSHPELLAWLARELTDSHYDLKHIYRLILNSRTYQLSCIPSAHPGGPADFAAYPLRRLDAEVVIDALNQITGKTDEYSSMTPEPFTWIPPEKRSIALPDGSISSAFLDLFGRPPRDSGLLAERNNRATAAQRLHLLNSAHIRSKLSDSQPLRALFRVAGNPEKAVAPLYLTILSRYPTADEEAAFKTYLQSAEAKGDNALGDLAWALVNNTEFLYRH